MAGTGPVFTTEQYVFLALYHSHAGFKGSVDRLIKLIGTIGAPKPTPNPGWTSEQINGWLFRRDPR